MLLIASLTFQVIANKCWFTLAIDIDAYSLDEISSWTVEDGLDYFVVLEYFYELIVILRIWF